MKRNITLDKHKLAPSKTKDSLNPPSNRSNSKSQKSPGKPSSSAFKKSGSNAQIKRPDVSSFPKNNFSLLKEEVKPKS